jgi:putative ABC transport system ATP-binding protein
MTPERPPAIRIEDLAVDYRVDGAARRVLAVDRLRIEPGEKVALVGPSGCGKTTLLSVVAGLRRASTGRVEVEGVDLASLAGHRLDLFRAARIGIVFQAFNLLETSPIRRNIALPLRFTDRSGAAVEAWLDELLRRVGLDDRQWVLPSLLSTGERQRVAVARAVAGGARIILADEPTGNLDAVNTAAVMDLLFGFAREERTLVAATHDETILERFDRVIRI